MLNVYFWLVLNSINCNFTFFLHQKSSDIRTNPFFSFKRSLKESCNQLQVIKAKNDELITSLENQTKELTDRIQILLQSEELFEAKEKIMNQKIADEKSQIDRLTDELKQKSRVDEQLALLQQANEQLLVKEKELNEKLEHEKSNNARLIDELKEKSRIAEEMNQLLAAEKLNNARLNGELQEKSQISEQLKQLQQTNHQLIANEKKLNQQLETEKSNIARLKDELNGKQQIAERLEALEKANDQLISKEKLLSNQLETEQSKNAETIDDLNKKLTGHEQREQLLIDQNKELGELTTKQRVEIGRLQQMLSENCNASSELAKLTKEIDEASDKLRTALANSDALKKSLGVKEKLLNEKEIVLTEKVNELTKLKEILAETSGNKSKLDSALKQLKDTENKLKCAISDVDELKQVVSNYEQMKKDNQQTISELQVKLKALEEEQENWQTNNEKLKMKMNAQMEEMSALQKNAQQLSLVERQMTALKKSYEKSEAEKRELVDQLNAVQTKHFGALAGAGLSSPRQEVKLRKGVDIDSLMIENRTLQSKQKQLEFEVQELRKTTTTGRKIKRRSIHDDTRRISGFDSTMIDIETQTEPVDDKCACKELDQQVNLIMFYFTSKNESFILISLFFFLPD